MTHQGFIGSLGTSFLLVSSAVAILLIVGTIVAFEGFPGPSVDDSTEPFAVRGLGLGERPEPELVVPAPRSSPGPAIAAAETALAPPASGVAADSVPPDLPTGGSGGSSGGEVSPVDPPAGGSGGSGSGRSSDDGDLVAALRETVRDTTRVLRSTLDRLLPGVSSSSALDPRRPG
jgi:hypothetical protein